MTSIVEGMTSAEFISAINGNFLKIGTDIDFTMVNTYLSTLNKNFDLFDKSYLANNQQLTGGTKGSDFIKKVNSNFNLRQDGTDLTLKSLVNTGTHSPAIASNAYLSKYKNFKLGGLISFSMYTFDYSWIKPYNPYLFNLTNIDIATWIAQAVDAGIEYLVLTVHDNSGFSLFDNPITVPDRLLNQTYGYKKSDVALVGADTYILDKFVSACLLNGIEPLFYFCTTQLTTAYYKRTDYSALGYINYDSDSKAAFNNYYAKVFQYVLQTWGVKYIWLDVAGTGSTYMNDMQLYYDSIKAIDPTCQVIGNGCGDLNFSWFPYDISGNEEWVSSVNGTTKTWAQVLATAKEKSGTTYYVPEELCVNCYPNSGDKRWYWNNQSLRPQSEVQAMYDIAKANSSPMLLNLAPTTSGVIPQAQFDLFKNIVK